MFIKSLVCLLFLVCGVWSLDAVVCDCDNGDQNSACIPDGQLIELLDFQESYGYADYSVCSVYPGGGGTNSINHFDFSYIPYPDCVSDANPDDWDLVACRREYSYENRLSPGFTFETCPASTTTCDQRSGDSDCGLAADDLFKCNFGVSQGNCLTVRLTFPLGMKKGSFGSFVKSGSTCEQGCSLGPSCDECPAPPPPPVHDDLEKECSEFNNGLLPYCYGLDVQSDNPNCGADYATREARRNEHYHEAFQTKKSKQLRGTESHQSIEFTTEEFQKLDHFNPHYSLGKFQNGVGKKTNIPFSNGAARVDCPSTATSVRVRLDGLSNSQEIWVAGDGGSDNNYHGSLKGPFKSERVLQTRGFIQTVEGAGAIVVVEGPGSENVFVSATICSFDSPDVTKRVHRIPNKVVSAPPDAMDKHFKQREVPPSRMSSSTSSEEKTEETTASSKHEEEVYYGVADGWEVEGFGSGSEGDFPTQSSKRGYTPESDCFCQEGLVDDYRCTDFCERTNDGCTVGMECMRDDMLVFPREVPEGAVAHISFPGFDDDGNPATYICSGGLLGQVLNHPPGSSCTDNVEDYCPDGNYNNMESKLFLTAGHCLSTEFSADGLELYFNYSISCEQGVTGNCYSGGSGVDYSYNQDCVVYSAGADLLVSSEDDQFSFIAGNSIWLPYGDFTLLSLTGDLPPSRCYFGYSTFNYATRYDEVVHRVSHPKGSPRAYADSQCSAPSAWEGGPMVSSTANRDGDYIASLHVNLTGIGMSSVGPQGGSSGGIIFNDLAQVVGTQTGFSSFYGWIEQPNNGYTGFLGYWGWDVDVEFDYCKPNHFSDEFVDAGVTYKEVNQYVVVDGSFYAYFGSIENVLEEICCPPFIGDSAEGIVGTTKLDFTINPDGSAIVPPAGQYSGYMGDDIYDRWSDWGVTISTQKPGEDSSWATDHPPQLLNSSNPCCGSSNNYVLDLGSPNEVYNGPGRGSAGETGLGANTRRMNWVLIISRIKNENFPLDETDGGAIVFIFDEPVPIVFVEILNIALDEVGGFIQATDSDDVVHELPILAYGQNSYFRAELNVQNIVNLTVFFQGSGAVAGITFCDLSAPPLNSLGDRVWFDQNGNGAQEIYETVGVEGVVVQLHDPSRTDSNQRIAETVTDADGYYLFSSLADGDYVVSFYVDDDLAFFDPYKIDSFNGWSWSPHTAGSDTSKDSNANEEDSNDNRAITETITLSEAARDMTWDAGIVVDSGNICVPVADETRRQAKKRRLTHTKKVDSSTTKRSAPKKKKNTTSKKSQKNKIIMK